MKIAELKGRSREVIYLTLKGYTPDEIKGLLRLSGRNIYCIRARAFKLLGVKTDLQVMALAVREAREQIAGELQMIYSAHAPIDEILAPLDFVQEALP